jgi:hypothetical protein
MNISVAIYSILLEEGTCPKRNAFLHLVDSWAFSSSRNHSGVGLTEMACGTDPVSRRTEEKPQLVWHSLEWDDGADGMVSRMLPQMTFLPQFLMVLLTPDVPHGLHSGRKTCCVSHDQTLFTTGTWWAR